MTTHLWFLQASTGKGGITMLLKILQVAAELGLAPKTIRALIKRGELRGVRLTRQLVTESAALAFVGGGLGLQLGTLGHLSVARYCAQWYPASH